MKTSIALIGFMGSGKSTLAQSLAARSGKRLIEVDSLISETAGKSIQDIFREDGEIAFRELEIKVIKDIASGHHQIIDCGGGVPLNKINIDRLRQNAIIVWLTASPDIILSRTAIKGNERPLLREKHNIAEIQRMISSRELYYQAAADIKIDTSKSDISTLTETIIEKATENADFSPSK
jgi:shikimate kinase